jgi:hypothetical protein
MCWTIIVGGQSTGKSAQQGLECLDPAGRRADRDQARAVDDRGAPGAGRGDRTGVAAADLHAGGIAHHLGQLPPSLDARRAVIHLGTVDRAERQARAVVSDPSASRPRR